MLVNHDYNQPLAVKRVKRLLRGERQEALL